MKNNCKFAKNCYRVGKGHALIVDGECQLRRDCSEGRNDVCTYPNDKKCLREQTFDKCVIARDEIKNNLNTILALNEWCVDTYSGRYVKKWCEAVYITPKPPNNSKKEYFIVFRCDDYNKFPEKKKIVCQQYEKYSDCLLYGEYPHDISGIGKIQFIEYEGDKTCRLWPCAPGLIINSKDKYAVDLFCTKGNDLLDMLCDKYKGRHFHVDNIVNDVNGKLSIDQSGKEEALKISELFVEWFKALEPSAK